MPVQAQAIGSSTSLIAQNQFYDQLPAFEEHNFSPTIRLNTGERHSDQTMDSSIHKNMDCNSCSKQTGWGGKYFGVPTLKNEHPSPVKDRLTSVTSEAGQNGVKLQQKESISLSPPLENADTEMSRLDTAHLNARSLPGIPIPSMQAAVVTPTMGKTLCLQYSRIQVRAPNAFEVVVRIAWTGLCRSDACFSVGPEPGYPQNDHIAGHEGIGHIVQSQDPSLLGRPVAARYLASTCQCCRYCLRGTTPESCPSQKNFPKHHSGTFQQYINVPVGSLMLLPQWVFDPVPGANPGRYTAALCSGSTALKALRASQIRPNDVVVVIGIAGAIGHLAGMMAKNIFKARVIGVDLASKADSTFLGWCEDVCDKFLPAATAGEANSWPEFQGRLSCLCAELRGPAPPPPDRADAVVVAAGSITAFDRLPEYVCDGGSIVCVGAPRGGGVVSLPLAALVERQLRIQGTMMGGQEDVYQVMEYIRSGAIRPRITEIGLEGVPEQMGRLVENGNAAGKLVARVNGPLP